MSNQNSTKPVMFTNIQDGVIVMTFKPIAQSD